MSPRQRLAAFALCVVTAPSQSWADSTDPARCESACKEREGRTGAFLEIDANTGQRLSGSTRFPQGQQVKVIVTRKNPLKYAYRVEIVATPLEPAVALAWLSLIPGLPDLSGITPEAAAKLQKEAAELAQKGPPCSGDAQTAWDALVTKAGALAAQVKVFPLKEAQAKQEIGKRYNAFLEATDKDQLVPNPAPDQACSTLCRDAGGLLDVLPQVIDLGTLTDEADKLEGPAAEVGKLIEAFEAARDGLSAKNTCRQNTEAQLKDIRGVRETAEKTAGAVKKLAASKPAFEAMKKLLGDVLDSLDAFEEVHRPFLPDSPTNLQVTIYRRNLRQKDAAERVVASVPIHVGESRLSISAGIGVSSIAERHLVRQAGLVPDGNGGTKTGSVFGYDVDSSFRPAVAILLNGTLWRTPEPVGLGRIGFAVSSGFVVAGTGEARQLEYILGGSFTLLDENLFLTAGLHMARLEDIAGRFKIGDPIPEDLNDPLPTRKAWAKGVLFALTFKTR